MTNDPVIRKRKAVRTTGEPEAERINPMSNDCVPSAPEEERLFTLAEVLERELLLIRDRETAIGEKGEVVTDSDRPGSSVKKAKSKALPNANSIPMDEAEAGEGLREAFRKLHDANLSALCFSGGGIRSATFGLGIVEALADRDLLSQFDYLSTVSGGGYLGSWLSAWIKREQRALIRTELGINASATLDQQKTLFKEYNCFRDAGVKEVQKGLKRDVVTDEQNFDPSTEPKQLQFLREYSNYMTPKVGLLSADTWTFIGIYLRNLFLNWTIFIPLIAAIFLIPKILLAIVQYPVASKLSIEGLCIIALLEGSLALLVVITCLPSLNPEVDKPGWSTDGGVVVGAVTPLVLMAFTVTTLILWHQHDPERFLFWPLNSDYGEYLLVGTPGIVYLVLKLGVLLYDFIKFVIPEGRKHSSGEFWRRFGVVRILGTIGAALAASIVGGVLIRTAFNIFLSHPISTEEEAKLYVCFAVPLILLIFTVAATMFVGFASRFETDGDREWFARFGSWILIACFAWIFLTVLSLWGPAAISAIAGLAKKPPQWDLSELGAKLVPVVGIVSGIVSLLGGFTGKSKVRDVPTTGHLTKVLSIAPQIAAVVFLVFILAGIASLTESAQLGFSDALSTVDSKIPSWLGIHGASLKLDPLNFQIVYASILFLTSLAMACVINVNKFSLHGAYRDRLIRAYLGASKPERKADPFTGFDDADNFQLHRLKGQRPFHVVNATLNLVDGENLAWQNRKAASFVMSPLHCGSWALRGYRNTYEYSRNRELGKCLSLDLCNSRGIHCRSTKVCKFPGKALRSGTAMAISGAAANPNMGYYSSPVVMFLMALFNIRLGWWLGNTNDKGGKKDLRGKPFYTKPSPTIAIMPLISETLGRTDEERRFINVSDGGHFENLGLYEMVLRRCKFIVVSDAGADESFAFDDLANAVEKCEVDLGVEIVFRDGITIPARRTVYDASKPNMRFAIARIKYPKLSDAKDTEKDGLLLYIKPTILGNEPIELKHYAEANPTFPHQSTADQLFDEKQFEAYRALGFLTMSGILGNIKPTPGSVSSMFKGIKIPTPPGSKRKGR